jgi:hypothetical protein
MQHSVPTLEAKEIRTDNDSTHPHMSVGANQPRYDQPPSAKVFIDYGTSQDPPIASLVNPKSFPLFDTVDTTLRKISVKGGK